MKYPWTEETMRIINSLTPDVKGKAFDPDWFLLRQRFEQMERQVQLQALDLAIAKAEVRP